MRIFILVVNLLLTVNEGYSQVELLSRVREHLRRSLSELPRYTCVEVMERRMYTPNGSIAFHERLRVQVLAADKQEQFTWPEGTEFRAAAMEELISAGAVGASSFAAMIANLLGGSSESISYYGIETLDGVAAHRFDFRTPLLSSKQVLTIGGQSARIPYSGSFWVEQHTLDLLRLHWTADDIPPHLDCREVRHLATFGGTYIRGRDELIPSAAELVIVNRQGGESRNTITFSGCQRFTATTAISFVQGSAPSASAPTPIRLQLPAGLRLVIRTERAITSAESAVGDLIYGRLDAAVASKGVVLPKGTRLIGRLRRLEHHFRPKSSFRVGLEFLAAESKDGTFSLRAHLIGPRAVPDIQEALVGRLPRVEIGVLGLDIEDEGVQTGVGLFRTQNNALSIRPGFRTIWVTH